MPDGMISSLINNLWWHQETKYYSAFKFLLKSIMNFHMSKILTCEKSEYSWTVLDSTMLICVHIDCHYSFKSLKMFLAFWSFFPDMFSPK